MQYNVKNDAVKEEENVLPQLLGMLSENALMIALSMLLFFLLSLSYVIVASPVYQADALVQVEAKDSGLSSLLNSDISAALNGSNPQASTEINIIQSERVIGAAVDALSLTDKAGPDGLLSMFKYKHGDFDVSQFDVSPELQGQSDGGLVNWLLNTRNPFKLVIVADAAPGDFAVYRDDTLLGKGKVGELFSAYDGNVKLLINQLHATPGQRFFVLKLPKVTAIGMLRDQLDVEESGKDSGVIKLSLKGREAGVTLAALEHITDAYVKQNVQTRAEEAQRGADFLREQLPRVKSDLYKSESEFNAYRLQHGSLDMDGETKTILERVAGLEQQSSDLRLQQAEMSREYAPNHPAYKALEDVQASIRRQQAELKQQIASMPESQQVMLRLSRDVEVNEQLYMQMLNRLQELDVERVGTVGNVRVVDEAELQIDPVRPRRLLMLILGLTFGLAVGVFTAAVRSLLKTGVESVEELEQAGINVISVVPLSEIQAKRVRSKSRLAGKTTSGVLSIDAPDEVTVEALRSLRTNLHFALQKAANNVIMISGASPNVGKTFVSANLAALMVQNGMRVLIVDADLRKGTLHHVFGISPHDGLAELLQKDLSRESVIRSGGIPGLDVIPRGAPPANPSELIMGGKFSDLISWASQHYDVVLIDTPPVLAVTDAAVVGRLAATTILIVRHRLTPLREVEFVIKRLEQGGIQVNGCVLNALQQWSGVGNYGYGYYAYGYKSSDE